MGSRNESEDSDLSVSATSFLLISEVDPGVDGKQKVRKIGYLETRSSGNGRFTRQKITDTGYSQSVRFRKQQLYMYSTRLRGKERVVQMTLSLWK
jgi:hypothetical protein